MATQLVDAVDARRFELVVDGEVVAFEDYRLDGDVIELVHTEVVEGHDGQGHARVLVEAVLAEVRTRGLAVLPFCPYVAKVIRQHPDRYLDLVPESVRAEFDLPAEGSEDPAGP
jgi:predicted GNAT family acetyltransferase